MSHKSITQKSKYHKDNMARQSMTISQYVERLEERRNAPARIINGIMEVCVHGCHWVSVEEFDRIMPPPVVHSFNHDVNNIDGTKLWMIQ